jgi:hypothetical protein
MWGIIAPEQATAVLRLPATVYADIPVSQTVGEEGKPSILSIISSHPQNAHGAESTEASQNRGKNAKLSDATPKVVTCLLTDNCLQVDARHEAKLSYLRRFISGNFFYVIRRRYLGALLLCHC